MQAKWIKLDLHQGPCTPQLKLKKKVVTVYTHLNFLSQLQYNYFSNSFIYRQQFSKIFFVTLVVVCKGPHCINCFMILHAIAVCRIAGYDILSLSYEAVISDRNSLTAFTHYLNFSVKLPGNCDNKIDTKLWSPFLDLWKFHS